MIHTNGQFSIFMFSLNFGFFLCFLSLAFCVCLQVFCVFFVLASVGFSLLSSKLVKKNVYEINKFC